MVSTFPTHVKSPNPALLVHNRLKIHLIYLLRDPMFSNGPEDVKVDYCERKLGGPSGY